MDVLDYIVQDALDYIIYDFNDLINEIKSNPKKIQKCIDFEIEEFLNYFFRELFRPIHNVQLTNYEKLYPIYLHERRINMFRGLLIKKVNHEEK